jgi:hypothetical protein
VIPVRQTTSFSIIISTTHILYYIILLIECRDIREEPREKAAQKDCSTSNPMDLHLFQSNRRKKKKKTAEPVVLLRCSASRSVRIYLDTS